MERFSGWDLEHVARQVRAIPFLYNQVTPFFYAGTCAASPFLTYNADILYLSRRVVTGMNGHSTVLASTQIQFRNENDVVHYGVRSCVPYYDGAEMVYAMDWLKFDVPMYFSRIQQYAQHFISFDGYILSIV